MSETQAHNDYLDPDIHGDQSISDTPIYDAVEAARERTDGAIEFEFPGNGEIVLYGYRKGNDGSHDVCESCDEAHLEETLDTVVRILANAKRSREGGENQ